MQKTLPIHFAPLQVIPTCFTVMLMLPASRYRYYYTHLYDSKKADFVIEMSEESEPEIIKYPI